jgi:hypothetical protein
LRLKSLVSPSAFRHRSRDTECSYKKPSSLENPLRRCPRGASSLDGNVMLNRVFGLIVGGDYGILGKRQQASRKHHRSRKVSEHLPGSAQRG